MLSVSTHRKHRFDTIIRKHVFIPGAFFHSFEVDCSETAIDAVDGDFRGCETDDGPIEGVEVVNVGCVGLCQAVGEDVET